MLQDSPLTQPTRRIFLVSLASGASALGLAPLMPTSARATPQAMTAAMKKRVGEAPLRKGKVKIDLPPLVENGNVVPMTVSVESPMTASDHVKAIHVFNEKNPQPNVFSAYLTPRNGRAVVSTRIRLSDTQRVVAVAEMSDGSFWSDEADVIVTLAACVETI